MTDLVLGRPLLSRRNLQSRIVGIRKPFAWSSHSPIHAEKPSGSVASQVPTFSPEVTGGSP